ncbi:MAG: hypothetical protein ACKPKO_09110, partial [Candidatus Fonsibacter sp.]
KSNGSFGTNGYVCSSDGALLVSPASLSVGCKMGDKPWFLIQFALCRGENSIDGYDRQYLTDLGFHVKSKYDVLASADDRESVINRNDAVFVHCCCENGNL